jgi:uncharacterized paraquat-inducible protein A
MAQVVLVLLTVIAVAAAAAMAPGRLRNWAARRRPPAPRAPRRPSRAAFLAVCASCLEMVETAEERGRCPSCGGDLAVRRRIHSARAGTPAAR